MLSQRVRRIAAGAAALAFLSAGVMVIRPALATPQDVSPLIDQLSGAFERVAQELQTSVVSINAVIKAQSARQDGLGMDRNPFFDFFGDQFREYMPQENFPRQGQGSGFILNKEGYVLTNNHVAGEASELTVVLDDGRQFDAKLVGADPKTDLAVLKIEGADNLRPVKFGDSDDLRVGQWVVAAGNPFGLSSSITSGIVSAKGRSRVGVADYEDFIQTDAAINPGNSGGPLVNLHGEVVGVNTAIFTRSGGSMGIGFAIPINLAKPVINSLIEHGRVVRGYLGVFIQNLTKELADSFDYKGEHGAVVGDVVEDGPAAKAGLEPEDIIVSLDGRPVVSADKLRFEVAGMPPGTPVHLEVFRDGKMKTITVEIGELQREPEADRPEEVSEGSPKSLGLHLRELDAAIARRLGLEESVEGVLVESVEPMSTADKSGVRQGDVIVRLQDTRVHTVEDFKSALKENRSRSSVRLTIQRGEGRHFVVMSLPKERQAR